MREQPCTIGEVISGPTEIFVSALQDMRSTPVQHDFHLRGWRYFQYLADAKLREAAMREEVRLMIKRRNDWIAARREQFLQAAE